ncbi:MAG: hypothetical protein WC760_00630 [Bacteroidia bacterium]|jgi:hypothetical protein
MKSHLKFVGLIIFILIVSCSKDKPTTESITKPTITGYYKIVHDSIGTYYEGTDSVIYKYDPKNPMFDAFFFIVNNDNKYYARTCCSDDNCTYSFISSVNYNESNQSISIDSMHVVSVGNNGCEITQIKIPVVGFYNLSNKEIEYYRNVPVTIRVHEPAPHNVVYMVKTKIWLRKLKELSEYNQLPF